MTATVLAADGRQVVLSPTGIDALRHVHRAHIAGGWCGAASMHAASRQKLLDAGLIEWCDDRRHVLGLTLAGLAAIEQIDTQKGPTP